jgi:hypothetical protein
MSMLFPVNFRFSRRSAISRAPVSAHFAISATSSSLRDGSFLICWIPMFFSMYQGSITPACGPMPVRCLMARAQGRVVLCTTLEDRDAFQLLTMLRLDRATRDIPVLAVTPYGECDFGDADVR